jgi:hypothetical protein
MKFLVLFLTMIPLCLPKNSLAQKKISYALYCNARFGYCIKYPDKILKPQREAQNGDGRAFTDKRGDNVLLVFGSRNDDKKGDPIPIQKIYDLELKGGQFHEHPNRTITYSKLGKTFYVISGIEDGKIYYQKTFQLTGENDGYFAEAILTYDQTEKLTYDQVSKDIFSSFK